MVVVSLKKKEIYFDLLRRGSRTDIEFSTPRLFLNDNDLNRGSELLRRFGVEDDSDYACISFRAVAESRRWGMNNYIELIKYLISERKLKVVLVGSVADRDEGDTIAEATSTREVVNLAGKTDLREAAAILSGCRVFVGNDSGPAHLAAAVDIPVVVLSGADDPKSTTPLATRKQLIYLENLDCISCVKNKCPLKNDRYMQCMTGISVEYVTSEIDQILIQTA